MLALIKLKDGWGESFTKIERFLVSMVLSFLAYYVFKHLDKLGAEGIDLIINNFSQPIPFLAAVVGVFFGGLGLFFSIMAAATIASLVPKHNKTNSADAEKRAADRQVRHKK